MKALDSLLDSLGDFADKAADKIAILGSKMYQFAVQTNATRDAVRDLLNSTNLVDDAVVARFMTGSYTEDESSYGNFENDKYEFLPNIYVRYHLVTGDELFEIVHKCGFINHIKTRIIIIQENSPLTSQ